MKHHVSAKGVAGRDFWSRVWTLPLSRRACLARLLVPPTYFLLTLDCLLYKRRTLQAPPSLSSSSLVHRSKHHNNYRLSEYIHQKHIQTAPLLPHHNQQHNYTPWRQYRY